MTVKKEICLQRFLLDKLRWMMYINRVVKWSSRMKSLVEVNLLQGTRELANMREHIRIKHRPTHKRDKINQ